jgi:hypothetical protein
MHALHPSRWSINARFVLVATIPALIMFLVIPGVLYVIGKDEAAATVRHHGVLVATALAETSEYGVVSGNAVALERNMRRCFKPILVLPPLRYWTAKGVRWPWRATTKLRCWKSLSGPSPQTF